MMKSKTITNRITALVMAAVMTVGNLNLSVLTVNAEPGWTKTVDNTGLGTGAIGDPKAPDSKDDPWTGSYVYYGTYGNQAAPVKYRVLDRETDRFGGKTIFLDCDTSLFYDAFRDDNTAENANVWAASDIYTVLNGDDNGSFLNSSFTGAERSAIAESSVGTHDIDITVGSPNNSYLSQYTALDKDRIFLLDFEDVLNPDYGYYNDCGSINMLRHNVYNHKKDGIIGDWWLRTASSDDSRNAGLVCSDGVVYGYGVLYGEDVSPAFNINLSSVIFSSEIKNGTGDNNYGAEYKLTVSDNKLSINVGNVTRNGNEVSIPYNITDSSDSAEPDRVSVIVVTGGEWTDAGWSDGTVLKQYEKPDAETFGLSGTGTFTLDDDLADDEWGKDYRVYILAEDENDDEKGTDYASAPVEIKAINASVEGYEGAYDGQAHGISITVSDPESGAAIKYGTTAESCVLNESPVVKDVNESAETVYYQITAPGYLPKTGSATIKINKADTVVTAPVAKEDLKVSDTAQELVTTGKAEGGELFYVLGTDDKTAPTEGWSKDVPSAKDAGTYYVWYKAVGDKNHKDTEPACVKVIIAEKAQDEKPEEVITDPVTEKQEKVSEQVKETINDVPVSAYLAVSYPMAVEWTGKKVTKAQLEALLNEGETLAKLNISGLEEALKGRMKEGTDVSKLFSYSFNISKDKDVGATGYFTVKVKLNSKAVKKAKIKGADKKALTKLVKALNDKLKETKFEFKIVPLKLAKAESVSIRAKLKNGALQQDEQGNLTGLKSVKIKIKIKGFKKAKTFTYSAKKAAKLFKISITDPANKKADLTAIEGTSFTGSKTGITVTK